MIAFFVGLAVMVLLAIFALFIFLCVLIFGFGYDMPQLGSQPNIVIENTEENTENGTGQTPQGGTPDTEAKTVTVMVYLNGTDLEEDIGSATADIEEMLAADYNENVRVIIETIGTSQWEYDGISGKTAQRYLLAEDELVLLEEDLGQEDVTSPEPLAEFIQYSASEYPADRYFLILWNHGGGPVYGYGTNSWDPESLDSLTLDELQTALADGGVYFEMIGFDACLMGAMEVAYALSDYGDYLIASEDFESASGWEYQYWLSALAQNPAIDMETLGKMIVDDFVTESEEVNEAGILALIDLSYAGVLYEVWKDFAYEAEITLLENNFSFEMEGGDRSPRFNEVAGLQTDSDDWWEDYGGTVTIDQYCAVDMLAAASCIESDSSKRLIAVLDMMILYAAATADDSQMTGMSVTLPYGDEYTYELMWDVYLAAGFDDAYLLYLWDFAKYGASSYAYDWSDWTDWNADFWNDTDDWNSIDWDNLSWEDYEWLLDILDW